MEDEVKEVGGGRGEGGKRTECTSSRASKKRPAQHSISSLGAAAAVGVGRRLLRICWPTGLTAPAAAAACCPARSSQSCGPALPAPTCTRERASGSEPERKGLKDRATVTLYGNALQNLQASFDLSFVIGQTDLGCGLPSPKEQRRGTQVVVAKRGTGRARADYCRHFEQVRSHGIKKTKQKSGVQNHLPDISLSVIGAGGGKASSFAEWSPPFIPC